MISFALRGLKDGCAFPAMNRWAMLGRPKGTFSCRMSGRLRDSGRRGSTLSRSA